MSGPLHPDVQLSIHLGAILSRNCYTKNPDTVIDELRRDAGDRTDILEHVVGRWIGFYRNDLGVDILTAALSQMTDLDLAPGIELGQRRKNAGVHSNAGFRGNAQPKPRGD